jgi:hypothetical protein
MPPQELTEALTSPEWCARFADVAVKADSSQENALSCLTVVRSHANGSRACLGSLLKHST